IFLNQSGNDILLSFTHSFSSTSCHKKIPPMIYLYSIIEGLFFTDFFSHSRNALKMATALVITNVGIMARKIAVALNT
ncbi:MAG: hypothetical protein U0N51_06625, partial [Clostridia bacterium]